ncbi:TetR/AcrR family transcriptional regulator [Rhizobium halophytocola]|uniref:TetR/AcrR family transcriptional repressor of the ameABC operon n=1 Tax=Rhizobium halophytocola TaxID=735519 RepID=A0ABS4E272_9HYPH|nr:TetR/AcrR family transcriptional regulator [Rhizobium halophytocola]MBP1852045.1 TetR/AcrR family transcriptional repressor of the ameABC operon [Rhizobium halophytocola]
MADKSVRRPRRRASETRQDILDTAETLFRARGYASVAMADVAAALDMSPANVFKHFRTKSDLVTAITLRHLETAIDRLARLESTGPAPTRMRRLIGDLMEAHLGDLEDRPHLFEMVMMATHEEQVCSERYCEMMTTAIRQIIEDGCREGSFKVDDPERAARATFYSCNALLHPLLLRHTSTDKLATRLDEVLWLVIAALQPS